MAETKTKKMSKYRRRPRPGCRDVVYAVHDEGGNWHLYETASRVHLCGILGDEEFRRQYEVVK